LDSGFFVDYFLRKQTSFALYDVLLYNYRQPHSKEAHLVLNNHLIMGQHLARSIRGRPVSPPLAK